MLVVRDTAKFVERPNHNELKPRLKNDGVCCVFVRLRLVSWAHVLQTLSWSPKSFIRLTWLAFATHKTRTELEKECCAHKMLLIACPLSWHLKVTEVHLVMLQIRCSFWGHQFCPMSCPDFWSSRTHGRELRNWKPEFYFFFFSCSTDQVSCRPAGQPRPARRGRRRWDAPPRRAAGDGSRNSAGDSYWQLKHISVIFSPWKWVQ